jgi:hypothetical protein
MLWGPVLQRTCMYVMYVMYVLKVDLEYSVKRPSKWGRIYFGGLLAIN